MFQELRHRKYPEGKQAACSVVRWPYPSAVAKALEELDNDIQDGLKKNDIDPHDESVEFVAVIKDGSHGMGEV